MLNIWYKHALAVLILVLGSFGFKVSIWQLYPQIFNDTPGYMVPALNLLNGRGYGAQENGFRTPTYPLFLTALLAPLNHTSFDGCTDAHRAVCIGDGAKNAGGFFDLRVMVSANIVLGFVITLLLYAVGWQLTGNGWIAFLFGAGYAWNIATGFWEISLLTETLTTFLLMLSVLLTLRVTAHSRATQIGLGITLGALALCHQLYLAFWVLPAAFLALRFWREGLRVVSRMVAPVLLIPIVCILVWSTFNYFTNDFFTPSTLSGYVLIQMVAPAMENAPAGYDGITQTYIGYRDAQIQQAGTYAGAIYRAWRDIMSQTGLTWSQISAKLENLSLYLAYHYPGVYFDSVRQVAADFWSFALFHYDPIPGGLTGFAAHFTDATLQKILNVLFWFAPLFWVASWQVQPKRKQIAPTHEPVLGLGLLYVIVWYAAILSALTNFGDNARYRVVAMPLQYGVITVTLGMVLTKLVERSGAQNWLGAYKQKQIHGK